MSAPSVASTIFCCQAALQVQYQSRFKLHNDPNRELHEAIFHSFISFAVRRQHSADLLCLIMGIEPESSGPGTPDELVPQLAPVFNQEALQNNPLTLETPYVIHLTSRHDFGPVFSHRYFVCPSNLNHDWIEVSLMQWFARGEAFKMKAEKWDLKCKTDAKFFRLTLRPNLQMRGCYSVSRGDAESVENAHVEVLQPAESLFSVESSRVQFMPSRTWGARQGERVAVGGTRPVDLKSPWTIPKAHPESAGVLQASEFGKSCIGGAHSVKLNSLWPAQKVESEYVGILQEEGLANSWGAGSRPRKLLSPWTAQHAESESSGISQAAAEPGNSWSGKHGLGESLLNSVISRNSQAGYATPWNVSAEPLQQAELTSPWDVNPKGSVDILQAAALGLSWNKPPACSTDELQQAEMLSPWEIKQEDLDEELRQA
ncbi:hypothetical protein PZA11_006089 [Diplocarpon coronariae]